MANISLTRVNQKLAQASAMLNAIEIETLPSVQYNALKEAAAFHMVCAYQHYLREIAETYGLKNASSIHNETDLIEAFQVVKKHPVEAQELMQLKQRNDSWLKQLNRYYESLWAVPVVDIALNAQSENDVIKAVNIDVNNEQLFVEIPLLLSWRNQFVALVTRHRQTSAEF